MYTSSLVCAHTHPPRHPATRQRVFAPVATYTPSSIVHRSWHRSPPGRARRRRAPPAALRQFTRSCASSRAREHADARTSHALSAPPPTTEAQHPLKPTAPRRGTRHPPALPRARARPDSPLPHLPHLRTRNAKSRHERRGNSRSLRGRRRTRRGVHPTDVPRTIDGPRSHTRGSDEP
jgi:hypothetical protein